jgi:hypothetical protein
MASWPIASACFSSPVYGGGVSDAVRDEGGAASAAPDEVENIVKAFVNIVVRHANYTPAFIRQPLVATNVMCTLFVATVRRPIDFDDEPHLDAREVRDIG